MDSCGRSEADRSSALPVPFQAWLLQNPLHPHVARASCPCFMGGTPMPRGFLHRFGA